MTVKDKIIKRIEEIDDELLLTSILEVLNLNQKDPYQLTDHQLSIVNEGLEDLDQGRIHTEEEANHLTKEWLKKR